MSREPHAPPGWTINPSAPARRAPTLVFATVGLVLASLHFLESRLGGRWDALSVVDRNGWVEAPPLPPAPLLDVFGFVAILAATSIGRRDRWRSHPTAVIASGLVSLLVAVSTLTRWSLQYAVTATTSATFSILTASAVACAALAIDELYAAVMREKRMHRGLDGRPYRSILGASLGSRVSDWPGYVAGGGAIVLGLALLVAAQWSPPVAAFHARLVGALIATIGALSLPQASRSLRWVNGAIGVWLLCAPLLHGYALRGVFQSVVFGFLLLLVSVGLGDPDRGAADARTGSVS